MKTGGIALVFSALALGLATYGVMRERPRRERAPVRERGTAPDPRVTALQLQVVELMRKLDVLAQPGSTGRRGSAGVNPADGMNPDEEQTDGDDPDGLSGTAGDNKALAAIVDDAVDRKTKRVLEELRVKANKKPGMKVFASALELTNEQREAAERVVVDGQRKLHAVLAIPTAGGSSLMDELVEIMARGIAQPGKDHGFGRWFARVASEKVPGTNQTYVAQIESIKTSMRTTFKRDWSKAQFKEFEEWGVDPTEIQNVPNSPNTELFRRITDRAKALGPAPDDE